MADVLPIARRLQLNGVSACLCPMIHALCYTRKVTSGRWLAVVRVMAIVLLTLAAADLFVPNLCGTEATTQTQSTKTAGDQDDCFCCCAHVDRVPLIVLSQSALLPMPVSVHPTEDLSAGVPRSLYHPPLHA